MIARMRQRLAGRASGDRGAILIIAIFIVAVVAVVTGAVLTRGEGSLRATVALRDVARSSYAADAAAQVAINDLRTGYNIGNGEPSPWYYTNAAGTGCFGYDGSGSSTVPKGELTLNNVIPKGVGETQEAMSAVVVCEPEDATGDQGSAVPINSSNRPGYAIVALGDPVSQTGGTVTASETLNVHGGIYANGAITGPVVVDAGTVKATGSCTGTTVTGTATKSCGSGPPISDPNYNHELGSTVPVLQQVPTSCTSGVAEFTPGYYDSAAALNTAMGLCRVMWFKPGNYYFDFHDETCTDACPDNLYAGSTNVWTIPRGKDVIGGTPTNPTTGAVLSRPPSPLPSDSDGLIPGNCQSPITNVNALGVQFVFGGNSRLFLDGNGSSGARMELCATYHADRPPIEIYGLKTGSIPSVSTANNRTLTSVGTPTGSGTWTNLSAAALSAVGGGMSTWDPGSASSRSSTITVDGFTPPSAVPAGSVLKSAVLHVRHQDSEAASTSVPTATIKMGTTTTASLPLGTVGSTTMTTTDVTLNASSVGDNLTAFNALQRAVHDGGYTGAAVAYTANSKKNVTTQLDAITLDLTYVVPVLRGEAGTCITSGVSCPLLSTDPSGNNKINMYLQGTTYAPYADINLVLSNFSAEVAKFGVVARRVEFSVNTGNPRYTGPVFEIPDDSPGFGFETTLVRLKVYLCAGVSSGCTVAGGELALESRVKLFDDGGDPGPPHRQVEILNWSHQR